MPLLPLIVVLVVVGVIMALLPMDDRMKQLIYVVAVIVIVCWLLGAFLGWPAWRY
jgi:hypothetical protein